MDWCPHWENVFWSRRVLPIRLWPVRDERISGRSFSTSSDAVESLVHDCFLTTAQWPPSVCDECNDAFHRRSAVDQWGCERDRRGSNVAVRRLTVEGTFWWFEEESRCSVTIANDVMAVVSEKKRFQWESEWNRFPLDCFSRPTETFVRVDSDTRNNPPDTWARKVLFACFVTLRTSLTNGSLTEKSFCRQHSVRSRINAVRTFVMCACCKIFKTMTLTIRMKSSFDEASMRAAGFTLVVPVGVMVTTTKGRRTLRSSFSVSRVANLARCERENRSRRTDRIPRKRRSTLSLDRDES